MNVLFIIAGFLLGSSVLQGVGFFLYSKFYKKRFIHSASEEEVLGGKVFSFAGNSIVASQAVPSEKTKTKVATRSRLSIIRLVDTPEKEASLRTQQASLASVAR